MQVGARLRTLALATLLVVASGGLAAGRAQAATPAKTVLINVVGWEGDASTPEDPLGLSASGIRSSWSTDVKNWFVQASNSAFNGVTVATNPIVSTIPTPHSDSPDINNPRCDHQFLDRLADSADAAVRGRGLDPNFFDIVADYFGDFGCVNEEGDDFHSAQRGNRLFFQGISPEAPMREVGHLLGLSSAEALRCTDGVGHPVTLSSSCFRDPQGDVWDLMGNGTGMYSAGSLDALGWLAGRTDTVQACDCSVHKTLHALSEHGGPLGIELQDGRDAAGRPLNYWLEYRKPSGLDEPGHNGTTRFPEPEAGLIVHRQVAGDVPGSLPVQQLLDLTPDGDFDHAALPVGRTWANPLGTMQVTLDALDASAGTASITISRQGVQVPDVRYANLVDASKAIQAAGLNYHVGDPTIDPWCNNLDDVVTETPAPGQYASAGSVVTISLGKRDPNHDCPDRTPYLLVNVGWNETSGTPESPLEPSKPEFTFLHGTLNAWFNTASLGKSAGFGFIDGGSYMIDTPSLSSLGDCDLDFDEEILRKAKAAAAAHGFDFPFIRYVIHWSAKVCPNYSGLTVPHDSNLVLLQGAGSRGNTAMHEFGHVLGLGHSGSVECRTGDVTVPLSNDCTVTEYGDRYSAMGVGRLRDDGLADLFTASHLAQLGWLDDRYVTVQAQDVPTIPEVIEPLADTSGGVHAVKLVDGPTTLWIEYRQPIGLDAQGYRAFGFGTAEPGLIIHREIPRTDRVTSLLLDMQPGDLFDRKFDLPVGQTWANPLGTMKITLDSSDASSAHITIGSNLRNVPDVRNQSLMDARSAIEGAGFVWGGTSQTLTSNCELIGSILGQSPSGNTRQPAGSAVTPSLGVLDPRFQCK